MKLFAPRSTEKQQLKVWNTHQVFFVPNRTKTPDKSTSTKVQKYKSTRVQKYKSTKVHKINRAAERELKVWNAHARFLLFLPTNRTKTFDKVKTLTERAVKVISIADYYFLHLLTAASKTQISLTLIICWMYFGKILLEVLTLARNKEKIHMEKCE